MVYTPPLNHSNELSGIGGTGHGIEEQTVETAESEKTGIVAKTGQTLSRFTQVLGLTGALAIGSTSAMAEKSPYEPLAQNEGTQLVLRESTKTLDVKSLEQRGFSPAFASTVVGLWKENQDKITQGKIPNEKFYTIMVEHLNPIVDAKRMELFVKNTDALVRADEKTLGLPSELGESTLTDTMDRLFEGDDSGGKSRCSKRITKLQSAPNSAEALATLFRLYNDGKKSLLYPSRESYRQLLITSLSLTASLYNQTKTPSDLAPSVMTQMGEYMALTDAKASTLVKINIGGLDYIGVPTASIRGNANIADIPSVAPFLDVSNLSIEKMGKSMKSTIENGESAWALAQEKWALAQEKWALAQKDQVLAQKDQELIVYTNIWNASDKIGEYFDAYRKKRDENIWQKIEQEISILQALQKQLQTLPKTEENKKSIEISTTLIRNIFAVYGVLISRR